MLFRMKITIFVLLVCLGSLTVPMNSQAPPAAPDVKAITSALCKAPVLDKAEEPAVVESIRQKLDPFRPKTVRVHLSVIRSEVVNAWTLNLSEDRALICLPTATLTLMDGAEAELAFVIGHEIGHALDKACKAAAAQARATQTPERQTVVRECERRADEIGFALIRRAGYSPFAAAGAFGRWEMFSGDMRTGLLAHFLQGNHPITPDRIENLRQILQKDVAASALNP